MQRRAPSRTITTLRRAEIQEKSGVNAAQFQSGSHAVDRQHVSGNPVVDLVEFRIANHLVEGALHDVEKALVDFALAPEKTLAVLNPLEVTDGNAAGIAENIGDGENTLCVDDGVGLPGGGAVGTFAKDFGLDLMSILLGDLVLNRGGDEHIARLKENVAGAHLGAAAGKFLQGFFLGVDPVDDFGNVEPFFVVEAAADVGETNDFVAGLLHQVSGKGTHVAEALNDDASGFFLHAELGHGLVHADHHATAGGFAAATRAAEFDGLTGNDGGRGLAGVHGVCIHDPSHGLLVGADVGSGNVALWAKPIRKFSGVAAGEALKFPAGQFAGIADDAAFGAAERNVHHGALPGHPGREGADFIEADVGSKTDAALAGTSDRGMKDAVTDENFELAVVHADGDVKGDFLIGIFKVTIDTLFKAQFVRGHFKTRFGVLVNIHFLRHKRLGHAKVSSAQLDRPVANGAAKFGL